ncbi:hypothetical protein HY991_03295 [Candidatus Micrarchaeota archaeon]|nr:hypothetical protein [Candidatus Micrarchaeota archaeon]
MGWTKFETKNAKYILYLELHGSRAPKGGPWRTAHILVLEGGSDMSKAQLLGCVNERRLRSKEVWFVDPGVTVFGSVQSMAPRLFGGALLVSGVYDAAKALKDNKRISRREFLKRGLIMGGKLAAGTVLFPESLALPQALPGKINRRELLRITAASLSGAIPSPLIEFRNAVSAEKIERYLAPQLAKQVGRKPTIALVYGADHGGLVEHLKNPRLRKRILNRFKEYAVEQRQTIPPGTQIHASYRVRAGNVERFVQRVW